MNSYEQMKNRFLVEVDSLVPHMSASDLELVVKALDVAANSYEVTKKEVSLIPYTSDLPELVKTYLVVKKTEGLSDGTLDNYMRILKLFFKWVQKPPEKIEANDIRMFIYDYQKHRNVSDRTLDKYRETICWFFHWAHNEEYISKNPGRSVKAIKHEVKERSALSQLELEYLRKACSNNRDRAVLEFLYSTGCRVSELVGVKEEDINWADKTVHLFGKGKKHRTSFINAKCEVALKEYLKEKKGECDKLFVGMRAPYNELSKAAIEKIIRDLSEQARITKRVTPHILRHTTATQAVNNGMAIEDVSSLLGHANVNTTMIYAKVSKAKVHNEHIRCVI